jgi:hypothetical protein
MLGGAGELTRTQVCSWIGAENETPVDFIKPLNLYLHSDEPGWHPSPPLMTCTFQIITAGCLPQNGIPLSALIHMQSGATLQRSRICHLAIVRTM